MAKNKTEYHEKFDDVFIVERDFVKQRWEAKAERRISKAKAERLEPPAEPPFDPDNLRGLALSGGGIRSASFCMGVVQQLHVAGVIDRLHYMSTVSGGGYTGCSLSWFLAAEPETPGGPRFGAERDNFPFLGGDAAGIRNAAVAPEKKKEGPIDGRKVLDYIRQRSSYLNPGAGFSIVSAIAIVLRSLIVSLVGYILLAALLFVVVARLELKDRGPVDAGLPFPWDTPWLYAIPIAAAMLIGILSIVYSLLAPLPFAEKVNYGLRRFYQIVAGVILGLGAASLALALVMELIGVFTGEGSFGPGRPGLGNLPILGALTAAVGAVGGLVFQAIKQAGTRLMVRIAFVTLPPASLLLLVAGIGALGFSLADFYGDHWVRLLVGTALYCLYANINLTGLHRFYRDRLMESFLPDYGNIRSDRQAARTSADDRHLADICGVEDDGPYHLINAHVVLKSGAKARFRSRQGDSFLLSPLFCGSEATGYAGTRDWLPSRRFALARPVGPMRLPTAMAISGAAANPHAGADGQGITKGGAVSAIMTLLNIRLGYWVPSPRPTKRGWRRRSNFWPPNFLFPGVKQGLLGLGHHERANWLELSDGGHFENTGIYELVRRGVSTIIFADGSTDPEVALSSFANALEKIYIDFGVTVEFDRRAHFTDLMKGTALPQDAIAQRLHFARAGFAIATLKYPPIGDRPGYEGTLIYIKSTMVRDLPTALYSYKATNPLFPAESLADQFFSEQQFEAYRALGFALTKAMTAYVRDGRRKRAAALAKALGLDARSRPRTARAARKPLLNPSPPKSRPSP